MCPWCLVTPACPCHRGGGPPSLTLGKALVAVARRSWRLGKSFGAAPQRRLDGRSRRGRTRARPFRPDFLRSMLGHCSKSQQLMIVKTSFAVLLMVSLLGLAACGDDGADEGGTTPSLDVETTSTIAAETNEPIVITTHLAPPNAQGKTSGEVVSGSTIGDSASAPGRHSSTGLW